MKIVIITGRNCGSAEWINKTFSFPFSCHPHGWSGRRDSRKIGSLLQEFPKPDAQELFPEALENNCKFDCAFYSSKR